jgi:hypothetical protein
MVPKGALRQPLEERQGNITGLGGVPESNGLDRLLSELALLASEQLLLDVALMSRSLVSCDARLP